MHGVRPRRAEEPAVLILACTLATTVGGLKSMNCTVISAAMGARKNANLPSSADEFTAMMRCRFCTVAVYVRHTVDANIRMVVMGHDAEQPIRIWADLRQEIIRDIDAAPVQRVDFDRFVLRQVSMRIMCMVPDHPTEELRNVFVLPFPRNPGVGIHCAAGIACASLEQWSELS